VALPDCQPGTRRPLGRLPAIAFVSAYLIFLLTGIFCAITPPKATDTVVNEVVPTDANCYRVRRKADYVTVEYAMGSPTRRVQVLLRLDKVVGADERSVRIFTERVMESKTFQCDSDNATCYDTLLLSSGNANADIERYILEFDYTNPSVEQYAPGAIGKRLGLAGEMYAASGYRYYLSATHLCVSRDEAAPLADTAGALVANVDASGFLQTNATAIASVPSELLGHSALYTSYHASECIGLLDKVAVMTLSAASESTYLALSDTNLYETEPEQVSTRRRLVELGQLCAATLPFYERAYSLYDIDCSNAYATCRTTPSLPFRRMSALSMRAHYLTDGSQAYFWFATDATLETLPGLANSYDAIWLAIVKLGLIVLAAAVMWVRSDRVTSSAHWLYRHCIQVANCIKLSPASLKESSVIEDAFLGLVAIIARYSVAIWRLGGLAADQQTRCVIFELGAAVISLINWVVRYWIITPALPDLVGGVADGKGPLTRLGGSMAIADASSAVLLAFAEPPLLLSAISRFDNTARLLTGLLISLVVLHRCLFACCCNAIILEAHDVGRLTSSQIYRALLYFALISWIYQIIALAVGMVDLVVTPMAYGIGRGVIGNDGAIVVALFLALVNSSLPRLLHTCVKLWDDQMESLKMAKKNDSVDALRRDLTAHVKDKDAHKQKEDQQ
jgi:hypothetical protein